MNYSTMKFYRFGKIVIIMKIVMNTKSLSNYLETPLIKSFIRSVTSHKCNKQISIHVMLCHASKIRKRFSGDLKHELTVHCQEKYAIRFIHRFLYFFFCSLCVCVFGGGSMIIVSLTHSMTHNWCTLYPHRISFFLFLNLIVFSYFFWMCNTVVRWI